MLFRSLFLLLPLLAALSPKEEQTLRAMQVEVGRSSRELKLPNRPPPYFISYWVVDLEQRDVEATLGSMVRSDHDRGRRAQVELRVGAPALDNSNFIDPAQGHGFFFPGGAPGIPRQTPQQDPFALRHTLWLATDDAYKRALEALERKKAARQVEVQRADEPPSFSPHQAAELLSEGDADIALKDDPAYGALTKRVSSVFRDYPQIQESSAHLTVSAERRYFVSSEGARALVTTPFTELSVSCQTQADDGMHLSRSASLASLSTMLPDEAEAVAEARRIAAELDALRRASLLEDYSGPVLFEGRAAAQIVHDLLSEALSGTPPPKGSEYFEGPLARKLGKRILPPSFSAWDDPISKQYEGHSLLGHYLIDDEGVPPQRVSLVEAGRLKSFVMSRTPSKEVQQSNGHGRSGLVGWARGKVGNLILKTSQGLNARALRARLLRAAREEGSTFGVIIRELEPRSAGTNGQAPADPDLVYKVSLDGKEELVRGARFGPLSVRTLREILAAGNDVNSYHYTVPSQGGFYIPSTVIAPSLLFEDIHLKKRAEPNKRPPLVPRPGLHPARQP
jgi:TldD protein